MSDGNQDGTRPNREGSNSGVQGGTQPAQDVERIADKVYRLMMADARLSHVRGEPQVKRKRQRDR